MCIRDSKYPNGISNYHLFEYSDPFKLFKRSIIELWLEDNRICQEKFDEWESDNEPELSIEINKAWEEFGDSIIDKMQKFPVNRITIDNTISICDIGYPFVISKITYNDDGTVDIYRYNEGEGHELQLENAYPDNILVA